ncbi:MAG: hypothetical protein IT385_14635 [Deltaproteobacteria bacterium]|nr:hypothetical protein [Deltaproteobacteria bacterium]
MKAPTPDAILTGHGLVAPDVRPSKGFRGELEPVHARAYRHPGLPGRTIVRLVQERIIPSEDATVGVLGLVPIAARSPVVARARRRAIGFPAAAIVLAPELARFALEITRDFQREVRRIKAKPGHAMQGFTKLADELGRSVPAFLPSFWEEAGRAFIVNGNGDQAAQCFGKARAAEDAHGLEVVEDERHEAFLEFALAGGLAIGTLTDYAKTLERRFPPAEAYRRFLGLCRERVLGGMPPFGGMAKELARLAKAAKLDVAAEERALLAELLGSPAIASAPQAFWDASRKALRALAQDDPAVLSRLLELRPSPTNAKPTFADFWIELLEEVGAIEHLIGAHVGVAAVVEGLLKLSERSWRSEPCTRLAALFERLTPRLIAEGTPVALWSGRWRPEWDVDLLELALARGVPVKLIPEPGPHALTEVSFDLSDWAKRVAEPGRGRDPVHIARHPRLAQAFSVAVGNALSDSTFQAAARGKVGFRDATRVFFERLIAGVEKGGLYELDVLVSDLSDLATATVLEGLDDVHARLAALDVVPALARTLRAGLPDELVWPAWEAAIGELGKDVKVIGPPPLPILTDGSAVRVLGAGGVVHAHDLRVPKGADIKGARWVGGDLLVMFDTKDGARGYWASAPSDVFDLQHSGWHAANPDGRGFVLPGGGWSEGRRGIVRGDQRFPETCHALSDGQSLWQVIWDKGDFVARELDPGNGKNGRASLPAQLAAHAGPEWRLSLPDSRLSPVELAPGHVSPLGTRDGLEGWCVRTALGPDGAPRLDAEGGHAVEGVGIDGRRLEGRVVTAMPAGLIDFPGHAGRVRVGRVLGYYGQGQCWLEDPTGTVVLGKVGLDRRSAPDAGEIPWASRALDMLPFGAWHHLVPRDEAASRHLRALGDDLARALFERVRDKGKGYDAAAVNALVPEIGDEVLVTAIARRVRHAVNLHKALADVVAASRPGEGRGPAEPIQQRALSEALRSFDTGLGWRDVDLVPTFQRLVQTIADPTSLSEPSADVLGGLFDLLGREGVVAWLAASPAYEEHRDVLIATLALLQASPLPPAARIRTRDVSGAALKQHVPLWRLVARDGVVYHCPNFLELQDKARLIEVAPRGDFGALPGVATLAGSEAERGAGPGPDWISRALALVRERGAMPCDPALVEALAERAGMTRAEAALVWLGLPGLKAYEKNFLPKAARERVGLKVDEAHAAKEALARQLDDTLRWEVLGWATPADPAELWDAPMRLVDRLAAAWRKRFGARAQVDGALLARLRKEVDRLDLQPAAAAPIFTDPASSTALQHDRAWSFVGDADLVGAGDGLDEETLTALVIYTMWLFAEAPVGDPMRAGIPAVVDALRQRLAAPGLIMTWGRLQFEGARDMEKARDAFIDALPGARLTVGERRAKDVGPLRLIDSYGDAIVYVWPARLGEPGARELVEAVRPKVTWWNVDLMAVVEAARSPGFAAMAERVRATPVPVGGFEASPLASAPDLVKKVYKSLGVSAEAAAYYLQLLVLPNPTDARVAEVAGWSGKDVDAAAAELVDKELVVEGKRARAGRQVFLPGGWVDLKAPHPPIEQWKLAFHGLAKVDGESLRAPLRQILAREPLHALFARAWAEVEAGRGPRFEEAGESRKAARTKKKGGKA